MKASIEICTGDPGRMEKILGPSLESSDKVDYSLDTAGKSLEVEAETDSLGTLRACSDTVFRLASLSLKL